MADFLSRLVERTYGLMQVAEPVIIPSFAAASNLEYTGSSVFDVKPGPDQGVSQPHSMTQPVKYPGHNAGIREEGTVANNRAENSPFEATGTQVISGHEQSDFDLLPGTMSDKEGRDMPDVSQQLPEDATWKNEKTVYRPQPEPVIREMTGDDEPGFTEDIRVEHAKNGEKTVYHSQPEPVIHEMTGDDEPGFARHIHIEHAENEEKTVYHPQRLIHEMTGDDEPVFARDIHVEHAKNGEKTVYHPQPRPMISETPVNEENSSESRKTEIMAAEKKILYQPERSLNITGTPEDEVSGNLKKAYSENMKSSKDTRGFLQVQSERITHKPQTYNVNPENLQESVDKYQKMETGILILGRKETGMDKILAKNEPDLQHENSLPDRKMFQTYRTGESYISTQKRREIQDSLVSTAIIGTPASRRRLYQNSNALASRNPPEKHIAESHPEIKVTIGHVEVRAATKPAQVSAPSRQNPVLSLNDYLKKRNGNTL